MQVLAEHGRAVLAHLRDHHAAHRLGVVTHGQRGADVADDRRDDVASPAAVVTAVRGPALEANGRGVDGFLAERSEALALERFVAPANLAAHEELLQAVVDGAREHHAAEDLDALVLGQRRRNRLAPQEPVAGVHELGTSLLHPLDGRRAWRRVIGALRRFQRLVQTARQLPAEGHPEGVEGGVIAGLELATAHRVEDLEDERHREWVALGGDGGEPAGEAGELVGVRGGARHDLLLCSQSASPG